MIRITTKPTLHSTENRIGAINIENRNSVNPVQSLSTCRQFLNNNDLQCSAVQAAPVQQRLASHGNGYLVFFLSHSINLQFGSVAHPCRIIHNQLEKGNIHSTEVRNAMRLCVGPQTDD